MGGGPVIPNALGGFYPAQAYARGGIAPPMYFGPRDVANGHLPELAPAGGPLRVWAEEETKGEGYVPLANDYRRPGAKVVTEQIVDHFGGRVEWFADGGHHRPGVVRFRGHEPGHAGGGDMRIVDARVTGKLDVETGQLEGRMRGMVVDEIEGHAAHAADRRRVRARP